MPTIYDNIENDLLAGLRSALAGARRADFCVGYFNLRGWSSVEGSINDLHGEDNTSGSRTYARLLVGMMTDTESDVRKLYSNTQTTITNSEVLKIKKEAARAFARQLTYGIPTTKAEQTLNRLAEQLKNGRLIVKLHARHPLHAKLYIAHRTDSLAPLAGFVGSSNLTLSGLSQNGELNVDVLEQDAAQKLTDWFEDRWNDDMSVNITAELAEIIENSWAGGPISPYHIYLKTAYHLSRDAIEESNQYHLPSELAPILLEHQKQAIKLVAQRLNHKQGVIVGDVVGLGKTLIAIAVAKILQEDRNFNTLVLCPKALVEQWENELQKYHIAGRVISISKIKDGMPTLLRYRLVVIDESHNFRNRKGKSYQVVRDYIQHNESRVMMLTATPYNKAYTDIASQLLLFLDAKEDLGIRPEELVKELGGEVAYRSKHAHLPSSLAAFENSTHIDDWRELMRLFVVRRTRAHIKANYATYDESKQRHYLEHTDGSRYYFPNRKPCTLHFKLEDGKKGDQYAKLYSEPVVNIISDLNLPRYGLKQYLTETAQALAENAPADNEEKNIIDNLTRAGYRLRGFARTGLFKRLESSGHAFLLSIHRHILRNAMFAYAHAAGKPLPIGQIMQTTLDAYDTTMPTDWQSYLALGEQLWNQLELERRGKKRFQWIKSSHFTPELTQDLAEDSEQLLTIVRLVTRWDAAKDRKLAALRKLLTKTHPNEKILLFSQYKDTVEYLHHHLREAIPDSQLIHGDYKDTDVQQAIRHFSPKSNNANIPPNKQIRVLFSTDKLSEGVNLQDAHIIVNYDLPWAIIRIIQRAGRVDRIGQLADTIFCYSALPEDGIERIITLRTRLYQRMVENENLIGSDEQFFEDDKEKDEENLRRLYAEDISLESQTGEDETDLISYAYDIWRQATKHNPALAQKIKALPDVVYSAKNSGKHTKGAVAYVQDTRNHHALTHFDTDGEVVTQSQYKILETLKCESNEAKEPIAEKHHDLVAKAVEHCQQRKNQLGGQLGSANSTLSRVYNKLLAYSTSDDMDSDEISISDLNAAIQQIHDYPLRARTRDKLWRQLSHSISDTELARMVIRLWEDKELCDLPKGADDQPANTQIICSLGLV